MADPWGELTVQQNPFLERPSLRWFVRLHLLSSFPILFPYEFNAPPLRVSTVDTYPEGDIGPELYEGRLLQAEDIVRTAPDAFSAGGRGGFSLRLGARSDDSPYPDLHEWVGLEHRGKFVDADAMDMRTGEVALGIFRGEIVSMRDDLHTVEVLCRPHDPLTWRHPIPAVTVEPGTYPYAPPGAHPTGGLGSVTNLGIGVGRRIPCRYVRAPHPEGTLVEAELVPDDTTEAFTATAHDFSTGAGPYRLRTTDTLPTGLSADVDYYVVVVDEDTIRLALTPGDALTNTTVALDDEGAGTLVLYGGVPANLDDARDFEVGHGNIGVLRVWEDDIPSGAQLGAVSDLPDTYEVLHREAAPGGRYVTHVRFRQPMDGIAITADVVRAYPDVDAHTKADWKFLRGFGDDVGGHDLVSGASADEEVTTGDLVPNQLGIGLGGVRLNGSKYLQTQTAEPFALQDFTVEFEWTPAADAENSPLWLAGRSTHSTYGASISYDSVDERVYVDVYFEGASWLGESEPGTVPKNQKTRIGLRRDAAAGTIALVIGGAVVSSASRPTPILYGPGLAPMCFGGSHQAEGDENAKGILGYACFSAAARTDRQLARAYYLMRRNGIEFARDVCWWLKKPVNEARFAAAAAAWDAVEGGRLHCDGWLTQRNEARSVFGQLVPFRDVAFGLDETGRVTADVATMPTTIAAQFGIGDQYANLLAEPQRIRASLTEAAQELVVRYRRARNGVGELERRVTRPMSLSGEAEAVLPLDFVDDPVTADIICDFQAKRRVAREIALDLQWGHEGRHLEPGDAIRVRLPAMGLNPIDLELPSVAQGVGRGSGRGAPVGLAAFTYTPKRLAADPPEVIYPTLDLSAATMLASLGADGGTVALRLAFQRTTILRPESNGPLVQFPTLVGASSHVAAVSEASPDGDAGYVQGKTGQAEMFRMGTMATTIGDILSVGITARIDNKGAADGTVLLFGYVLDDNGTIADEFSASGLSVPASGGYADYSITASELVDANGARRWQLADVNRLALGVYVVSGTAMALTQLYGPVVEAMTAPKGFGWVDYYVVGPSPTEPDPPAETEPVLFSALDLSPRSDQISGSSGDKLWYFARPRDLLGRSVGIVGPAMVEIP